MMYFLGFVAVLWSLGCFFLPLWGVWTLWNERDRGFSIGILTIGWPIGILMAIVPWGIFADSQSPNLATLKKNAWFCSASHVEAYTTYTRSGNATIPITNTRKVCHQYNRK